MPPEHAYLYKEIVSSIWVSEIYVYICIYVEREHEGRRKMEIDCTQWEYFYLNINSRVSHFEGIDITLAHGIASASTFWR